jgi:dienelactone hydrolase
MLYDIPWVHAVCHREILMHRKFFSILLLLILQVAAYSLSGQQSNSAVAVNPRVPGAQDAPLLAPAQATPRLKPIQEDWSALPLAASGLDPSRYEAVRLDKWDRGEATEELLRVQWREHDPIDLYVVRPKGVEKPPAILYLYDFTNDTERFRDDFWCKSATERGFAAVGFLSAVSGERIRMPRPMSEWFVSQLQESLGSSVHDVEMILNYLASRGDIDMSRIGMFGQGSGASIAVLAAAVDPRIKTLDLLDPWGDWPDWLKVSPIIPENQRSSYLTPEFLNGVAKLDPVLYLPLLKSQKVQMEYILDDDAMPKSAREAMIAAAPKNADVVLYKDTAEHVNAYHANGFCGWLKAQLQASPSPIPMQRGNDSAAAGIASRRP